MIVDSSALVAIIRSEPDAARYAAALAASRRTAMSAVNVIEAAGIEVSPLPRSMQPAAPRLGVATGVL